MAEPIVQLVVVFAATIGMALLFGRYIARMIAHEDRPLERTLGRIENGFYKIIGVDRNKQMTWKEYFLALVATNALVGGFIFLALVFQDAIPFATPGVGGLSPDLAFHTATSFVTNTNLQHYLGDQQLTLFSHMAVITFVMFVAPASSISAAFAFIRGFIRKNFGLGNFYVDFVRVILTLLLPVAFFSALLLVALGSPQTLDTSATVTTLEGSRQTITMGPVASLESIKELGSNGGGFYGANSGHPFENPTGMSNIYEVFLMLIIPLSFPIAYGRLLGAGRGASILIVMLIGFSGFLALGLSLESGPALLETRFGSFGSVLFDVASISTNTGAVNASPAGLSPNAVISLFLGMFVQAIPGAVGVGMMTMIVYIILTLFIVGLMVGKTPEFMSMKIAPRDVKIAVFIFLVHPAFILVPTAIAYATGNAQDVLGDEATTPFGYTQTLYEFTSAAANNGSDYFGASADTPFWNYSTGVVMVLGRYIPIGLMLMIAGLFSGKDRKDVAEPIKTKGPLFIAMLLVITFLLTALTFFPFLAIGPFSME